MNTTLSGAIIADLQDKAIDSFMDDARKECKSMEDVLAMLHAFEEYQYFLMNWERATA